MIGPGRRKANRGGLEVDQNLVKGGKLGEEDRNKLGQGIRLELGIRVIGGGFIVVAKGMVDHLNEDGEPRGQGGSQVWGVRLHQVLEELCGDEGGLELFQNSVLGAIGLGQQGNTQQNVAGVHMHGVREAGFQLVNELGNQPLAEQVLDDPLTLLDLLTGEELQEQLRKGGGGQLVQDLLNGAVLGLNEPNGLLGLLGQEDRKDSAKVAGLNGIHRGWLVEELPEFGKEGVLADQGLADGENLAAKDLCREARVPVEKREREESLGKRTEEGGKRRE